MTELPFAANRTPMWTPFERAYLPEMTAEQFEAQVRATVADTGIDESIVRATLVDIHRDEVVFLNNRYQVHVRKVPAADGYPTIYHLSLKRRDKERIGVERYRDLMRIKDELIGPDYEAVEIYPARSREVDTANQYHLWVFADPTFRLPFGFAYGLTVDTMTSGGKQTPGAGMPTDARPAALVQRSYGDLESPTTNSPEVSSELTPPVDMTLRDIVLAEVAHQPLFVGTYREELLETCRALEKEGLLRSEPHSTVHDAVMFYATRPTADSATPRENASHE